MRRTDQPPPVGSRVRGPVAISLVFLLSLQPLSAVAQVVGGDPGPPAGTTTLGGNQPPPPAPEFGGVIKDKASESTLWWPPRVVPPAETPNILLIMTDDQGFGAPSTIGGVIPTPAMDRLAEEGLRYTNFHSTGRRSS